MRYNGIYMGTSTDANSHSAADVLWELQVPANTTIEIIRCWIGADMSEGSAVQSIELYANDAVSTGGTGMQERELQGVDDAVSAVTGLLNGPTQGATPIVLMVDTFHPQMGWVYVPLPEERPRIVGGATYDNIGIKLQDAPSPAITIPYGVVWGELT